MSKHLVEMGILIVLVASGAFIWHWTGRGGTGEDSKQHLLKEMREFEHWEQHKDLLRPVIDEHHAEAYDFALRHVSKGVYRLEWGEYRSSMYREMVIALDKAGKKRIAVQLEQFRVRD